MISLTSSPTRQPNLSNTSETNRDGNPIRYVTPLNSSDHNGYSSNDDEDDIPHMLNPYSDSEDFHLYDENNYPDDHEYLEIMPTKPISFRANSPQHWQLPLSSTGYDIADSSPVSSISNFSCDQANFIDSGHWRRDSRVQSLEFPLSPKNVWKKGVSHPMLQPKMNRMSPTPDLGNNIHIIPSSPLNSLKKSFINVRSESPTQSVGSSKNSPSRNATKGIRKITKEVGRESKSDCLPPPSPRKRSTSRNKKGAGHRRCVSLNQIPSSSCSPMIGHRRVHSRNDDTKLSPLGENQIGNKKPPKPPPATTHRRVVSFPDHVLQNHGYQHNNIGSMQKNIGNISPLTLQSDDPALFSLLETTQSSRNGRVYIPNDVDPNICIPSINTIRSISPFTLEEEKKTTTGENQHHVIFDELFANPKKVEESRQYHKKHRWSKSGSGSISSSEPKLASLEEDGVLQSDEVATAFVEGKVIDLTKHQTFMAKKENNGRKRSKQLRLLSGSLISKSSEDTSLTDSVGNRKSKSKTSKKRDKKRMNVNKEEQSNASQNEDSLEKDHFIHGEAFVDQASSQKKNKDQCAIQ